MLDNATANILSVVNDQCKENTYVIIKNSDITPHLKKRNKLDDEAIKDTINYLAEREYIKLKHSEQGTYCLTMLPKGKLFNEDEAEKRYYLKQEKSRNRMFLFKIAFVASLFSFLGAAVATILIGIIF
jgi:hypothetical protein